MLGRLLIAVTAIAVTTGVANATPFRGTDTFADTTTNSSLSITATYDLNPISFDISQGQSFNTSDLLTLNLVDTAATFFGTSSANNNIQVNFDFSQPSGGTGTTNGSAADNTFSIFGSIISSDGAINWVNPSAITFTDGALLDVSLDRTTFLGNGTSASATIAANFKLVNAPSSDPVPVPEPGSLALLGTGLLGLGLLAGMTKKSHTTKPANLRLGQFA